MKRTALLIIMVSIFFLMLITPCFSWQGRTAGMGDANGLIEDESDLLTHPADIASGKDLNVYGTYRLTYDKATTWDYNSSLMSSVFYPYSTAGEEWKNEGLAGIAFPAGAGRMGIFIEYTGIIGKYSGDETNYGFFGHTHFYSLNDDLDNYAIRVLYGLPVGSMKLGGEIQIAYRNEENENYFNDSLLAAKNFPWIAENAPAINLFPYMIPYNSQYWEALGKLSAEGIVGTMKYAFTIKGGFPFSSKNEYNYNENGFHTSGQEDNSLDGNITGWNIGADTWLRFPVNNNMTLPFLLSVGYKQVKRDGTGISNYASTASYENETKDIFVKVGGGLDYIPAQGVKLAAGLYYDYLYTQQDMSISDILIASFYYDNDSDMPKQSEHRVTLKAAAEKEFSSTFTLRGGFSIFYGRASSDYSYSAYDNSGSYPVVTVSTSGYNMGVNASVGATWKIDKVSLEPFINGGYIKYSTSGDGLYDTTAVAVNFDKTNWIIGGGLSLKF